MKAFSFKGIWSLLKDSVKDFYTDKVTKLGASLAYFTLFSLGPLLLVIIFLAGLILGKQAVEGSLHTQMQELVGEGAAHLVQQVIKSAATSQKSVLAVVIGIITLLIGATSMFGEIQDSINRIWQLKVKVKQRRLMILKKRLFAFIIIACMGILMIGVMAATTIIEGLGKNLGKIMPDISVGVIYLISQVLTLLTTTVLFTLVFKILPAAKIRWRDVLPGSVVTALLFIAGRFAISFYINTSDIGSTYGVTGSLVVLLVWVYYSALMFYFGAEFIKVYAKRFGSGIQPKEYAVSTL